MFFEEITKWVDDGSPVGVVYLGFQKFCINNNKYNINIGYNTDPHTTPLKTSFVSRSMFAGKKTKMAGSHHRVVFWGLVLCLLAATAGTDAVGNRAPSGTNILGQTFRGRQNRKELCRVLCR